ncbi:PREDICTED: elongation of very long chain fatty acids protein 3 [Condylura cristata]|uniref:elongation of very long chain fatty acids protein 3 n=1 Tax=Condylura cristata TaxID=143302 RepID=UPI000334693C|nr:PREDICTED: elongation of very long chain fatty acids protein 3 [Condylura cristata]
MATAKNLSEEMERLSPPYDFELLQDLRPLLEEYWSVSYLLVVIYLLLIVVGQNYMKGRKGFNLQKPLILWSFSLAIFSILGTVRIWGFMGILLHKEGLKQTVCFSIFIQNSIVKFWSTLFLLSKIIELGDTAFIILRKRPLIFVHWYHHSTVLVYTSFAFKNKVPAGGWFMTMNLGVHAIMYTYYTLRAAKVKCPRQFSMFVTSLQVLQMLVGVITSVLTYLWRHKQGCHITEEELFWSFILYATYFILFAHFFLQTYIKPKDRAKIKSH